MYVSLFQCALFVGIVSLAVGRVERETAPWEVEHKEEPEEPLDGPQALALAEGSESVLSVEQEPEPGERLSSVEEAAPGPLEKVSAAIAKIIRDVSQEGIEESRTYNKFACWCKANTDDTSKVAQKTTRVIGMISANIADKTVGEGELRHEFSRRTGTVGDAKKEHARYTKRLADERASFSNTQNTYLQNEKLIDNALKSLRSSKPNAGGESRVSREGGESRERMSREGFLQLPDGIAEYVAMADSMGLITSPKQKNIAASLMQGPQQKAQASLSQKSASPGSRGAYSYHGGSNDIIDLVVHLKDQMVHIHQQQMNEHERATQSHTQMLEGLEKEIRGNQRGAEQSDERAYYAQMEAGQLREELIDKRGELEDAERVLTEVTAVCESRASENDQRVSMRKAELEALTSARQLMDDAGIAGVTPKHLRALLQIPLEATPKTPPTLAPNSQPLLWYVDGQVQIDMKATAAPPENAGTAAAKQSRAILQIPLESTPQTPPTLAPKSQPILWYVDGQVQIDMKATVAPPQRSVAVKPSTNPLSFLQELVAKKSQGSSFLKRASSSLEEDQRMQTKEALELVGSEGQRLNSLMLSSMAVHAEGESFTKVKDLVEKLIDRLQQEALGETTKKGFCDTEVAKSEHERETRRRETESLNTELQGLEARSDALKEAIKRSSKIAKQAAKSLKDINNQGSSVKKDKMEALKEQKEARDQIEEALMILRSFYSQAAKASKAALLQIDPVKQTAEAEKHASEAASNVPATARQDGMRGVLGLLQTVQSDFDREVSMLESTLDDSSEQTIEIARALSERRTRAETQIDSDTQDLKTTSLIIERKMENLETASGLLDSSLKQLESLKPMCIDTRMSYKDRADKREAEMKALSNALRILSPRTVREGGVER